MTPRPPEDDRPPRWPAVPAVVTLAACAALTVAVVWAGAEPGVATLKSRAAQAVAAGDDAAAALHYRHLLAIEPTEASHAYAMALAADRLGRRAEAMAVLTKIAPSAGGGFAPAHLKQAEWLVEDRVLRGATDVDAWAAAHRHAEAAERDPTLSRSAAELLDVIRTAR